MWNIFLPVCSRKNKHSLQDVVSVVTFADTVLLSFAVILCVLTAQQFAQKSLINTLFPQALAQSITSDELLLDPRNLPTYDSQINLVWKPIRSKISAIEDKSLAGKPQAALVNIYVQNNSWQLAWEYAQNIRVPIWRASALLVIADNQRADGINSLADRMLGSALTLLRPVHMDNSAPEIFAQAALSILARKDFKMLTEFFDLVAGSANLMAMADAVYDELPKNKKPIVLNSLSRLSMRYEEQYTEESFRLFLDLAALGEKLGIDEIHRGSIANAYDVSLGRNRTDKLRDTQLEELAHNLIFTGQHSLALQVIAQIRDRIIQSRLYATAGRVRAQIRKRPNVGAPLLSLANDSLLLLATDTEPNNLYTDIDTEEQAMQVAHARDWAMIEKAQAGLITEALRDAERIKDTYQKQRAISLLSLVLAELEQYDMLKMLVEKVDYANLRLNLYLALTGAFDNSDDVTNLLVEALRSSNFYVKNSGYTPQGLSNVLAKQIAKGNPSRHDEIFDLVDSKISQYLTDFDRILAQVEYLYHYGERSQLKSEYREQQLTALLSSLWPYTKHAEYGYVMGRIMTLYLKTGKPEQAFNVATSLSEDFAQTKIDVLTRIAEFASKDGDEALTLRVVNQLKDPVVQIDVLTDAINNLAKSREIQRF